MKPLWPDWPSIEREIARSERLLLFLDYDGTLVPIAQRPSEARLSAATKKILTQLISQPGVQVVLVSGRSLSDLKKIAPIKGISYIGNHGLEFQSNGHSYINPIAKRTKPILKKINQQLKSSLKPIPGILIEDKGLTLSVHYRRVPSEQKLLVKNGFYDVVAPYQLRRLVRVTSGKQVFEVQPLVHWNKGTMVNWFLGRSRAAADLKRVFALYVGDDETDEDAFEALNRQGVTVAVGPSTPLTRAQYTVEVTRDVHRLLKQMLEIWRERN